MGSEQVELGGGITFTDKTKDGEVKKVNAGEIVVDTIAEKRKAQEELEAKRREEWEKFKQEKQETAEIDPDLLEETEEERVAGERGFNTDGTKRKGKKDMPISHKKIDAKKFKKGGERKDTSGEFNEFNESNEFNEPEYLSQKTEAGAERQAEEKIENPELAEKINRMAELSGKSWDLFQRLEKIKKEMARKEEINKIYDDINRTSQELVILYYRDIKKEMDDPNIVYKIEGISEENAKRARGAIGRIEEGKTYIKIEDIKDGDSWMKFEVNKEDLEKLADVENGKDINRTMDIWGKNKTELRAERGREQKYKIKYFDPDDEYVELEDEKGGRMKSRPVYLYVINFDKADEEIKAEEKKTAAKETLVTAKKEAEAEKTEKIEPNPELSGKINRLAELYKERGKEYKNLERAKEMGRQIDIDEMYEKMNLLTKEMMILYYRDIKEKIEQDKINTDNLEKSLGESGKKAKEAIETINKTELNDISRQSFEKLTGIKDKRKEEDILTAIKDRKTLLRIKENAKQEYVLVTYNPGAEYSYVETPDGKDRQRVRSKDVYALNADVVDNIEKADAEAAK